MASCREEPGTLLTSYNVWDNPNSSQSVTNAEAGKHWIKTLFKKRDHGVTFSLSHEALLSLAIIKILGDLQYNPRKKKYQDLSIRKGEFILRVNGGLMERIRTAVKFLRKAIHI
jgi:hypothetical protein